MKLLLVEDDIVTRFIIKKMCGQLGHECVAVEDGEGGLAHITDASADYALVLMDIHMPRLSGLDIVSTIRASDEDQINSIPIYAVTADDNWQDVRRCVENGFDGVIAKPVALDGLAQILSKHGADGLSPGA